MSKNTAHRKSTNTALLEDLTDLIRAFNAVHGTDFAVEKFHGELAFRVSTAKERWVDRMLNRAYDALARDEITIEPFSRSGTTVIQKKCETCNFPHVYVAQCGPNDKYDYAFGVALAYARAIHEKIPDYVLS